MPGNSFGTLFQITSWGESHGPAIGVIIDGCPPKLPLTEKDIQQDLNRRRPGQSNITTSRKESDKVKILSGVFEGKTTGTSIALMIENEDQRSKDYSNIKNLFRPGHADLSWNLKYGIRDYRGGGRSSGRETVARVMAGAVAKKYLKAKEKTQIVGYTTQVGPISLTKSVNLSPKEFKQIESNPIRCTDPATAKKMENYILKAKANGDSVGGTVEIIVRNCPSALGEPVFDKLQADLGKALFSIATIKAVEFGAGKDVSTMKGSENNDIFVKKGKNITTKTNNAGGIYGGISIGTDLIIRLTVKPASSILKKQQTVDKKGHKTSIKVEGRHDACIIPRLIPVAESMIAITIMDHYLRQLAIKNGSL